VIGGLLGQRLYLRIWLAVVAAVAVLTLVVGWLWQLALDAERAQNDNRARTIVIRDADGNVLAQAPAQIVRVPGAGLEFQVDMHDGQVLYIQLPRPRRPQNSPLIGGRAYEWLRTTPGFFWMLTLVALAVALGAYPIVRRLTKRLEALQRGVERWGSGDLSTRLPVQGQDEVAFLAERFNAAAERVQSLLLSHKSLLANASHELRSPLARIRMGLELLGHDPGTAVQRAEMSRSIEELDQLIDEILLASRLDTRADDPQVLGPVEEVDLIGLAAEECARTGADLQIAEGSAPLLVHGHTRLLRRLIRNLLENARRYGVQAGAAPEDGPAVELVLSRTADGRIRLVVQDRGPGVPPELRERIFEPFFRLPGASEREGGVGLGLALVRTIAQRHGGTAHCEGREGGGARFVVELPA
jgi:two-component system OmpR family sensor kinase